MKNDYYEKSPSEIVHGPHLNLKTYVIGFFLCLALTLAAYVLVDHNVLSGWNLILAISGLGLIQVIIQFIFFLHLGQEPKPYSNFLVFLFMLLVLFIIVAGSLWIMYDLDYRVMEMNG